MCKYYDGRGGESVTGEDEMMAAAFGKETNPSMGGLACFTGNSQSAFMHLHVESNYPETYPVQILVCKMKPSQPVRCTVFSALAKLCYLIHCAIFSILTQFVLDF